MIRSSGSMSRAVSAVCTLWTSSVSSRTSARAVDGCPSWASTPARRSSASLITRTPITVAPSSPIRSKCRDAGLTIAVTRSPEPTSSVTTRSIVRSEPQTTTLRPSRGPGGGLAAAVRSAAGGCSETSRFSILSPLFPKNVTDFPHRGLRTRRLQHGLDQVASAAGRLHQSRYRTTDPVLVAVCLARRENPALLDLDLGRDPEDLQLTGDGVGQRVHADDLLLALLELLLVFERGVDDLRGEPAVLDPAQDAAGDRLVRAQFLDPGKDRLGLCLDLVGERLDVPGTAERVGDVRDADLLHQHRLGAQRDLVRLLARQREGLVERVGVQGVRSAEYGGQRLDGRPYDVVVRLLRRE